jgi:hypothetical protein
VRKKSAGWKPGWQPPSDPWDGSGYGERADAERGAKRSVDESEAEKTQRKAELKRAKAQARRQAKSEAQLRKEREADERAGVFAAVTRLDDEGTRHCRRCDGSDFKTERREGAVGEALAGGAAGFVTGARLSPLVGAVAAPFTVAAGAVSGLRQATFKICQTCGAAYPLKRTTNSVLG